MFDAVLSSPGTTLRNWRDGVAVANGSVPAASNLDGRAGSVQLPPVVLYPERVWPRPDMLSRLKTTLEAMVTNRFGRLRTQRLKRIAPLVAKYAQRLCDLSDADLRQQAEDLRKPLRRCGGAELDSAARAFAVIAEASARILNQRHYDVQLIGGYAMLCGMVAEMETGEGKTLTAVLPAATAALAGIPVHVVTVNDYLAQRDAEIMMPVYAFLGLSVGVVVQQSTPQERRDAYACDITYCTNKDLAFDYLRDRLAQGRGSGNLRLKMARFCDKAQEAEPTLLRGLHFAIVDEADSVMIDEARTPLILSQNVKSEWEETAFVTAMHLAGSLVPERDYVIRRDTRLMDLTRQGKAQITELTKDLGGPWQSRVQREEWIVQALTAHHLYHRDEHYIVRDGKVEIVDEYTGRTMADRFWSDGLHQMIEIKEGVELSGTRATIARMTYQRFFRRYRRLAGMSGTVSEVAGELWRVYRLAVATIPPNRPSQRTCLPDLLLPSEEAKWQAITEVVAELQKKGVPLLIGTRSVAASQSASQSLSQAGLDHVVLNAAQDSTEAEIVAAAGLKNRITIATNMAGRGTDIKLTDAVCALGGLHVIISERHDSRRIDRQLVGRCARQGQPGFYRSILSTKDPLFEMDPLGLFSLMARFGVAIGSQRLARFAMNMAQRRTEALHSRMRRILLNSDELLDHALAFAGKSE